MIRRISLLSKKEEDEEDQFGWEQRSRGIGVLPDILEEEAIEEVEVEKPSKIVRIKPITADIGLGVGAKATGGITLPEYKPLIEGLPMSRPEDKPKTLLEAIGVKKPTSPEELKMGIEVALGTWEEQKAANPELQKTEDFAYEIFKIPDKNERIATIQEALTGTPKGEVLKDIQSNLEKYGSINPPKDWKKAFKEEGILKTALIGPSDKYGKAESVLRGFEDIIIKKESPGADLLSSIGWKGMVLLMGSQVVAGLIDITPEIWRKLTIKVADKKISFKEGLEAIRKIGEPAAYGEGTPYQRQIFDEAVKQADIQNISIVEILKKGITLTDIQPRFAFGAKLYAGLPADEIAKAIIETGKVTAEIVKGLDPVKVSQVTQALLNTSPALASEFLKAVEKPEGIPKVEPQEPIIRIGARQKKADGGRLIDIFLPKSIADKIPKNMEWVSKIEGLPEEIKDKYTMVFNTEEEKAVEPKEVLKAEAKPPEIKHVELKPGEKATREYLDRVMGLEKPEEIPKVEPKIPTKIELPEKQIIPTTIAEAKEILKVDPKKPSVPKDKLAEQMVANKVSLADIEAVKGEKINVKEPKDIIIALRDIKAVKKEITVEPTPKVEAKEPVIPKEVSQEKPAVVEVPVPTKEDFNALDTTDKNKELFYEKYNEVYTETKKAYEKLIDNTVADLKEEGFKGVDKGGLKKDQEGYITGTFPTTSRNPKWYRDFYERNNKAPTNKDLREIAVQHLSQGHTEDYGEVPANPILTKLEAQLESYETILSDIKGGDYSFEVPANINKLNEKLKELEKENKKLIKEYEAELGRLKEEKKIIVGQTQKKIEIAERNILDHVMKGQIKEAKRAFREGKKEGIFEQKEHFHEVVARTKERKAKRDEIGKVKDILKKTKLRELRPERQTAIKKIIDEIDLAKMTEKTQRKLTSRLDFIKDNPENQIPPEKIADLERLNKKPLSDFTSRDIALVKDSILHEINLNKLKNKIIFGKEIKEAVGELKEARANVLKGKDIKKYDDSIIDSGEIENRGLWQGLKNFWNIDSFNPEVICEELDNQDHGVIMKYVFKGIDNGITDKERLKREMDIWFTKELEDIDISKWSKAFQANKKDIDFQTIKLIDGRTIKITKGERLSFLLHEKNEKNYAHLIEGGFRFSDNIARKYKITEDDLDEIINSATPEEVKVADALWKFFNEKIKPELNKTSIELNGWEIATEDNYYPIRTVSLDRIRDALKARKTFDNKTLEGMGIFKERINAKNALIIEDAFTAALKHLEATSSYIGLAKPLRYAKLILEDTGFQENVMRVYGEVYLDNLKRYLKEIEDDSINLDNADKLTVELINKLDSAILGLHIFVMFKQPVSYLVANTEIDSKYLKKALLKKTDFGEIRKYSPQLEQRIQGFIFRELGELGNVGKVRQFFLHKSPLNSKLLSGIRKADSLTIGKIWNAAKIETKEKYPDLSEEEFFNKVTERAEEVIRRTQPTWHPKDRSEVGRSRSIWLRLLTKYTSQRNKNRIVLKRATLKYNRSKHTGKDKIDLLKKYSIILIINGLLIEAINELRRKSYGNKSRSIWQYIVATIGTTLSNFYIVGDLFSSLVSKIQKGTYAGYDTGNIVMSYMDNAIDGLAELGRTLDQLKTRERYKSGSRKGNLKWKTTALRSLDKNASSLLAFKGIPYDNIKRLVSGVWKMAGEKEEKKPEPKTIGKPSISKISIPKISIGKIKRISPVKVKF